MQIASTSDATYLPHVATLIESMGASNSLCGAKLNLLVDASVTLEMRSQLELLAESHELSIAFLSPSEEMLARVPAGGNCRPLKWFRNWLPEMLPHLDRVLYLDGDVLVLQSLEPLWRTNLGDHLMAAVPEPPQYMLTQKRRTVIGELPRPYLNSGVLLMNLACMRAEATSRQLFGLGERLGAASNPRPGRLEEEAQPDQDAFNYVCEGRWLSLHPRWNCFAGVVIGARGRKRPQTDVSWAEALASPAILHFEGPVFSRPWNYRCVHPDRHLYRLYRQRTPWPLFSLEGGGPKDRLLAQVPPRWQLELSYARRRASASFRKAGGRRCSA